MSYWDCQHIRGTFIGSNMEGISLEVGFERARSRTKTKWKLYLHFSREKDIYKYIWVQIVSSSKKIWDKNSKFYSSGK